MTRLFDPERERPRELRKWQAVFESEGNIAAAWRCFRLARIWNLEVPETVIAELDRIAFAFETEVAAVRKRSPSARGLGQERAGRIVSRTSRGSGEPAAALVAWERDFAIERAVAMLRGNGETERAAVEHVAAGPRGLAYVVKFRGDRISLVATPTPAMSDDAVRKAVRRVRRLFDKAAGKKEITDLKKAPTAL